MASDLDDVPSIDPELLVATFDGSGRVIFRNEAWFHALGSETDPWVRLLADDRNLAGQFVAEASTGSLVTNQLLSLHVPDRDQPLPGLFNFIPVQHLQPTGRLEIVAVTVTGEMLAEPSSWTISQTQRHRLESLGRMTMGIAHDFNNLLSGIIGYTELVKTSFSDPSFHTVLPEYIHTIEQAAMDGASLIRKIQQYIRQEKQKRFEPIDLSAVVSYSVALMKPYWFNETRCQGISIETDLDLRPVPPVLGSQSELRTVFVNLILNAVQAMPQGGSIYFSTIFKPGQGVAVTVRDTGTGMPENVRTRIFEPLFTTKGDQGNGMGLAVSYGILQEHEASITVESEPGEGTRFELVFPVVKSQQAEKQVKETSPQSLQASILIVDDDQMVRSVLERLLRLKGHVVHQASSGAEALALIENIEADIIITDQGMPEMSGRQLARLLRDRFPTTPIVLLTGDTELGEPDRDITLILSKPFRLDILETNIQQLLVSRRVIEG